MGNQSKSSSLKNRMISLIVSLLIVQTYPCLSHWNPKISVCPGEGPRYGDFKCIHDRTHRVCAKLISDVETCQQRWNWKRSVCGGPNPGDSWCICMWATANIVAEVGCDNVQINCSATDVDYVLRSRYDGGWNLGNFKTCLRRKCMKLEDGRYVNR